MYTEGDTFLHRMDPRVKILSVVLLSILAFILGRLEYLVILITFIFALVLLSKARLSKVYFALKYVLRLMAIIVILWPFFDTAGAHVLVSAGPIVITEEAIWRGVTSAVRVGCLATVWYILMFTTPQRDLVRALVKLGLRFDFALTISISLRFFPTFVSTIASITDAQRARGLSFEKGGILRRWSKYVAILVPAVVSALRTADGLSLTLQSRAYGARPDRTYLRELRMRPSDYVALASVLAVLLVPAMAKFVLSIPI